MMEQRLSLPVQRFCALGLLALVLMLAWRMLGSLTYTADVAEDPTIRLLSTYKKMARDAPQWLQAQQEMQAIAEQAFITEASSDLAAAKFQATLKQLIETEGGTVSSSEILPDAEEEDQLRISTKVEFAMRLDQFNSLLKRLDEAQPHVFTDGLTIITSETGPSSIPALNISCRFSSFFIQERPNEE